MPPRAPALPRPPAPAGLARPAPAGPAGTPAPSGAAWALDRCPPAPLVRAGELCLPPGGRPRGASQVLGDVLVVADLVTPEHRATALALLLTHRQGVLVRATAAWVWTGEDSLRPTRVDLALPPAAPALPGPRPGPGSAGLLVRRTRWSGGQTWARLAGVGITRPTPTAVDCARRLPAATARTCLEALVRESLVDPEEVSRLLRAGEGPRRAAPPGTAAALDLLAGLG